MGQSHTQDLVFIGGGHSHALVLNMWAKKPLAGVRLTLVSPQRLTPYSGMLPGLIAGHYEFEQTHIDLKHLSELAQARFICDEVTDIDVNAKIIHLKKGASLSFDLVSINTGITPELNISGASERLIPVKPIAQFYPRWQQLLNDAQKRTHQSKPMNIAVVGAGAAGIELALAMHFRLQSLSINGSVSISVIHGGANILSGYPIKARLKIEQILKQKNIPIISQFSVKEIQETKDHDTRLISSDDHQYSYQQVFWCTSAQAPSWPQKSNLALDLGFIAVNDKLQSISCPFVFAAGDVAMQAGHNTPRAGVYAVRQAPILFNNLQRFLTHKHLQNYQPQTTFLSLLACGEKYAIGCRPRGFMPLITGRWVWHWKDRIDKKFMAKFKSQQHK